MATLITIKEACKNCGLRVTEQTLYKWARQGTLPGVVRIGRRVLMDEAVLKEFIRAGGDRRAVDR